MSLRPVVGIVGSAGAYGRWLGRFFRERMQLQVVGDDPADPQSPDPDTLLQRAQVLIFSAPIRHTPALTGDYVRRAGGHERERCGWT